MGPVKMYPELSAFVFTDDEYILEEAYEEFVLAVEIYFLTIKAQEKIASGV